MSNTTTGTLEQKKISSSAVFTLSYAAVLNSATKFLPFFKLKFTCSLLQAFAFFKGLCLIKSVLFAGLFTCLRLTHFLKFEVEVRLLLHRPFSTWFVGTTAFTLLPMAFANIPPTQCSCILAKNFTTQKIFLEI